MNQQTNNEKPTTIGCPSIGVGRLPEGFDGVEPLERTDYESIISDVLHTCNEAFIHAPHQREARPGYFKTVVGDIADALESVVPCDRAAGTSAHTDSNRATVGGDVLGAPMFKTPAAAADFVVDNLTPDLIKRICEVYGLKKRMTHAEYMTVAEGCKLTRFKATNATRLVAVRKGREGNADLLYEISVDHDNATAVIERDGELLYQIKTIGLSYRRCVHAAIQVLRAHLAENDGVHRRHRLSRQRKAEDRLDADPTAEAIENA